MNILIDEVPSEIICGGTKYPINTDFRVWIMFEQLLLDDTLNNTMKNQVAYNLIFKDDKPIYCDDAVDALLWFYCCGKTGNNENNSDADAEERRIYDYDYDDDYIYAAYLQQYGVDLQTATNLHWWQFRAMFRGLPSTCKFIEILGYRSIDITGDMPKSQKEYYRKMKKIYALPLSADEMEKTNLIEEALLQGKSVNNLL